jgi:hypothetical protein
MDVPAINLPLAFQMAAWKIERARQHIQSVGSVVEWMIDPENYVAAPELNAQTGVYVLRVGPKGGGLPHELPVWTGDAIHNLASALDYIWSGVARQANPSLATRVHFPRHETLENLKDAVGRSPVTKAFPAAYDLIVNDVKPYKEGNFCLWAVGKLDNIDKHRLFYTVLSIAKMGEFRAVSEDGSVTDLSHTTMRTIGPELTLGFAAPFKLNDDAEITVDVVFAEPEVLPPGRPVLQTLVELADAASETLETFKRAFL